MESLIVFIIFIVFSVLRSLGGTGQRAPGRGPGAPPARPMHPDRPVPGRMPGTPMRPMRPVRPVPPGMREFHPYEMTGQIGWHEEPDMPTPVVTDQYEAPESEPHPPSPAVHLVHRQNDTLRLNEENVLWGVIFSEILAHPKAVRKKANR